MYYDLSKFLISHAIIVIEIESLYALCFGLKNECILVEMHEIQM